MENLQQYSINIAYEILLFSDLYKSYITMIINVCIVSIIFNGVTPLVTENKEASNKENIAVLIRRLSIIMVFFIVPAIYIIIYSLSYKLTGNTEYFYTYTEQTIYGFNGAWALYAATITASLTLKITWARIISPYISHKIRTHRVKQTSETLSDIRQEMVSLQPKDYNPEKYFKINKGLMFLGLDNENNPIYEKDEDFKKRHIKVIGPTQTGKGVLQGVLLYQAILKGWGVGFFDIKPDDYIYSIMVKACKKAGRAKPIVVDLNGIGSGSYNMFVNGTRRDIINRIQNALNINETGTNADFYNVRERSLMLDIEKYFDGSLDSLEKLLLGKLPDGSVRDDYKAITEKSRAYVKEMKMHKPLNPKRKRGFNVDRTLESCSVFYIRGSITDKLVKKSQTIMLMDIIQSILRLGRQKEHIYLAIDEVKFLVSDMLSTGLSTVLSKGLNISVAYQSPANLLSLEDKRLNADAIKSEIEINTLTTISYRAADGKIAEEISRDTGTVNKTTVRSEEVEYGKMGAEKYTGRKQLQKEQEELVSINKMLSLPPRVGVLLRPNHITKVLYTSWIRLEEDEMLDIVNKIDNKKEYIERPKKDKTNNYSLEQFQIDAGIKNNKQNNAGDSKKRQDAAKNSKIT